MLYNSHVACSSFRHHMSDSPYAQLTVSRKVGRDCKEHNFKVLVIRILWLLLKQLRIV